MQQLIDKNEAYLKTSASGGLPVMVGKWSASLPSIDGAMTAEGRIALERIYTSGQLKVYNTCPAWFFQDLEDLRIFGCMGRTRCACNV